MREPAEHEDQRRHVGGPEVRAIAPTGDAASAFTFDSADPAPTAGHRVRLIVAGGSHPQFARKSAPRTVR